MSASDPQREVFVNSARVGGGTILTVDSASKAERTPVLPRGFFFGVIWGPRALQGKVRAKCIPHVGQWHRGRLGVGRAIACDNEVFFAGLAT